VIVLNIRSKKTAANMAARLAAVKLLVCLQRLALLLIIEHHLVLRLP